MEDTSQECSDLKLIDAFNSGSIDAFEQLIQRYQSKVYQLALKLTRNQEDAEEVMQDVFATLYRKLGGFAGKSAFSSWLYRVILNAAFMKLRKRKQNQTIYFEDLTPKHKRSSLEKEFDSNTRSDHLALKRELQDTIQTAIDRLPEQYRAIFVLRDVDGLSNQEVGRMLELSIPAVKSRLHRSRLMLRRRLRQYYSELQNRVPTRDVLESAVA